MEQPHRGGHEFLTANRTLWVDADDGSDTTGDGTQEKPYKTVAAALVRAHDRISNGHYDITVDFLTDYAESASAFHVITGDFRYNFRALKLRNSLKRSVTLGRLTARGSVLTVQDGFAFLGGNSYVLSAQCNGVLVIAGSHTLEGGNVIVQAAYGGSVLFNENASLTLRGTEGNNGSALWGFCNGTFGHVNVGVTDFSLNFEGEFKTAIALQNGSMCSRFDKCTVTADGATVNAKYNLEGCSYMDTRNRGTEWLPGTSNGTIDETSIIQ